MNIRIASAFLLLAAAVSSAAFASTADAEKSLRAAVDQVLVVTQKSKGGRDMADRLQPILERHVSFESMTRRAVGPGWRQFTPQQQNEATKLFNKLIIRSYSDKFSPGRCEQAQL